MKEVEMSEAVLGELLVSEMIESNSSDNEYDILIFDNKVACTFV